MWIKIKKSISIVNALVSPFIQYRACAVSDYLHNDKLACFLFDMYTLIEEKKNLPLPAKPIFSWVRLHSCLPDWPGVVWQISRRDCQPRKCPNKQWRHVHCKNDIFPFEQRSAKMNLVVISFVWLALSDRLLCRQLYHKSRTRIRSQSMHSTDL